MNVSQQNETFKRHHESLRDPSQIVSHWADADRVDSSLFSVKIEGPFWETLESLSIRLLVSREYEHLVVCLSGDRSQSYLPLPHPTGIAFDQKRGVVFVASTRNPNEIYTLQPTAGQFKRSDIPGLEAKVHLIPTGSRFFPGSLYLHDLAVIDDKLYGNATGHNAVVEIHEHSFRYAWWPNCVDRDDAPLNDRNYIQLNSIAAGPSLEQSLYSATTSKIGRRKIGDLNFPVDGRGVIFAGDSREPIAKGLTRPHSARFHERLYVDNSGYGELCTIEDGRSCVVTKLSGWTRGLACHDRYAFVGTSRVLPRFRGYAPGVDPDKASCGIHIVDLSSGAWVASLTWPSGNQIFAIEVLPTSFADGLPFDRNRRNAGKSRTSLFYSYKISN